jgi:hypothetical protein
MAIYIPPYIIMDIWINLMDIWINLMISELIEWISGLICALAGEY